MEAHNDPSLPIIYINKRRKPKSTLEEKNDSTEENNVDNKETLT